VPLRTTTCAVEHGAAYDTAHGGSAAEEYTGEVVVDRRTFAQHAAADCTYRLSWPGIEVRVSATLRVEVSSDGYDVDIAVEAYDGDEPVGRRRWSEKLPR